MNQYPKKFQFNNKEIIANSLEEEISIIKMIKMYEGQINQ